MLVVIATTRKLRADFIAMTYFYLIKCFLLTKGLLKVSHVTLFLSAWNVEFGSARVLFDNSITAGGMFQLEGKGED